MIGNSAPRAADLPVGSVVADGMRVYLKTNDDPQVPWTYTEGRSMYANVVDDDGVQDDIDSGAQVLRVGDGSGT